MSTSPVPSELLIEIFSFACDDIISIANVCSQWRALALASPHLWSHVIVRKSGKGLATILERSQSCPLTIRATLEDDPAYVIPTDIEFPTIAGDLLPRMMAVQEISPDVHKILEILVSHSKRWSDVSLRLSPNIFHFLDDFCGSFPILRKMHIEMVYPAPFLDGLPIVPSYAFIDAPQLTHLVIANIRFGVPFPWGNLLTLHLTKFATLVEIFDIVREAPKLTKLVATRDQNRIINENVPFGRGPLHRNFLREIEFHGIHGIGWLVATFVTPNLESFILDDFDEVEDDATLRLLCLFFTASSPPLRKLSIRGIMPNQDIPPLLRTVPTVTELVISQTLDNYEGHFTIRFGEHLARALLADDGLLPQLRSLNLYAVTYPEDDVYDNLTGSIFADMITSRWENNSQVAKLEHVRVGGYKHGFGTSVIERFESCRNQGLDISWVSREKSLPEEKRLLSIE